MCEIYVSRDFHHNHHLEAVYSMTVGKVRHGLRWVIFHTAACQYSKVNDGMDRTNVLPQETLPRAEATRKTIILAPM